jgi:phenylacetate-coenzyme A ligase PaaK-like adenylate-forming protein
VTFSLNDIIDVAPFSLGSENQEELYLKALTYLTVKHYEKCLQYRHILNVLGVNPNSVKRVEDVPFIPVRLFKEHELMSVNKSEVVKTMTSSGTTGQNPSKIFLDKMTAGNQTKVLAKIVSSFIGPKRLPMVIVDSSAVVRNRNLFSARGAGILGFSMFGYDVVYALDESMQIDAPTLKVFIEKHKGEQILFFGFTFMIWEHFYKALKQQNIQLNIENGIMIHGGGWKKLHEEAVSNESFKKSICGVIGNCKVYNYYGMIEQTGSIFMECEYGYFHSSVFSSVLIRDHRDFSVLKCGEKGLIQLLSLLPSSYPGHSILSEDIGEIVGEDNCLCQRKGKFFRVHGRIKNSEARGCSDTYVAGK